MEITANNYQIEKNCDTLIKDAINKVDVLRLKNTVSHLQGYGNRYSWENQWDSAKWVKNEFEKAGIDVNIETYEYNNNTWPNVIAKIKGIKKAEEIILPIAHIDSTSDNPQKISPGADDNATGVAAILEIAGILKELPLERSVILCIFTNEEYRSAGSKSFAFQARENSLNIRAVMNLDVLGFNSPRRVFYPCVMGSHFSTRRKLKAIYRITKNFFVSIPNGKSTVKMVGRQQDAQIVTTATQIFSQYTDIKVKSILNDNDCG